MRFITILLFVLLPCTAFADRITETETGLPITVDDATPTEKGTGEWQLSTQYEHTRSSEEQLTFAPQFQYGIAKDTEFSLTVPFDIGSAVDNHGGDLGAEILYNFIEEDEMPAVSFAERLNLPTGDGSAGIETVTRLLASKHIFDSFGQNAIHANLGWTHYTAVTDEERRNSFMAVIGASHGFGEHTALVADLVREQEPEKHQTDNLAELGLRQELAKDFLVSIGGGVGIGEDSPAFRTTLGVQLGF